MFKCHVRSRYILIRTYNSGTAEITPFHGMMNNTREISSSDYSILDTFTKSKTSDRDLFFTESFRID